MITIIGQGVPGLIFSHLCHKRKWPYQIIAPSPKYIPHKQILLNQRSIDFLTSLDITLPIKNTYSSLRITQSNSFGHIHIHARDYHQEVLCYSISMQDLIHSLKPKISAIEETMISAQLHKEGYDIQTDNQNYNTDYIIGCDGTESITQSILQISSENRAPYHICVIPAHIESDSLLQRYTKDFILASLPGPSGTIIISSKKPIHHIDIETVRALFGHNCEIHSIHEPKYFKITPKLTHSCYKHNALLLGNASLTIEPISAQGLNHTIAQIEKLSKITTWSSEYILPISHDIQKANTQLYRHMHLITQTQSASRLARKLLFKSQYITPLIHDHIWAFGNRHDN